MLVIGDEEKIVTQYVEAYVDWHGIVQDWLGRTRMLYFTFFVSSLYFIRASFSKLRAHAMCFLSFCYG